MVQSEGDEPFGAGETVFGHCVGGAEGSRRAFETPALGEPGIDHVGTVRSKRSSHYSQLLKSRRDVFFPNSR